MFDPKSDDIKEFSSQGFKSVINLKTSQEDQELTPDEEKNIAEKNDLDYAHIGVSKDSMNHETVDLFRESLKHSSKPVIIHCKSGKRSGAFVMMHVACEENMSGDDAIDKAEQMGFECNVPELKEFLKSYINKC